ncbi:MAG TPA: BlaI/MecI/CopY family transcriptional regulator [Gemmatimonadaceae bacterium]|nr:BlaI/MecI/CopY family transcriptional regulator [Gemmatimonadaceae bacterium]
MSEISGDVRTLIRERLVSMDHVEVVMRLREGEAELQTPAQLERSTRLGPHTVQRCLNDLVHGGLVRQEPASNAYAYAPRTSRDRAAIDELAALYNQRPVTLVKLIYEQPPTAVKSFADAFRLRDDDEEEGR